MEDTEKYDAESKEKYRVWFENTRKSCQKTIDQTETIFEGLVLKIASGAMAISFSFITALAPKIDYRFMWILAIGWGALAACIIINILSHLKAKKNCQRNVHKIDDYLWNAMNTDNAENIYKKIQEISKTIDDKNKKLDNKYNRLTAWLMIGGIVFILGFVFMNLAFTKGEQCKIQKETITHTILSKEKTIDGLKIIQKDTLSSCQIQQSINTDDGK
ncbi:hypothetical protein [Alistipes sp.]|jgi:multisubunit Na+/H+ antiporter MnhB subunit|uniref:hypothetical protein n=1 Tax=Alistipes sp. TaxID=1872444 RepID=UPI0023F0AD1A|nr:hypothetical protein [Alistipes sp.]